MIQPSSSRRYSYRSADTGSVHFFFSPTPFKLCAFVSSNRRSLSELSALLFRGLVCLLSAVFCILVLVSRRTALLDLLHINGPGLHTSIIAVRYSPPVVPRYQDYRVIEIIIIIAIPSQQLLPFPFGVISVLCVCETKFSTFF
jgi:hypothetical protein